MAPFNKGESQRMDVPTLEGMAQNPAQNSMIVWQARLTIRLSERAARLQAKQTHRTFAGDDDFV
jgi:hypothetical protein